jgi:hypothetical protein
LPLVSAGNLILALSQITNSVTLSMAAGSVRAIPAA